MPPSSAYGFGYPSLPRYAELPVRNESAVSVLGPSRRVFFQLHSIEYVVQTV